ncbi:MAG: alpha-L-fucosidase, partial [Betaproteobacteria bacterium]|nr:alpha-L-fucosidase [Betaproteobacteria bacterium]
MAVLVGDIKSGWMWPNAFAASDSAVGFPSPIVNSHAVMSLLQSSVNTPLPAYSGHYGSSSGELASTAAEFPVSNIGDKQTASDIVAISDFAPSSAVAGSSAEASSGEAEDDTLADYASQEGVLTVSSAAALRRAGSEFVGISNSPLAAMGEQIGQTDWGRWQEVNDPLKLAGHLSGEVLNTEPAPVGRQSEQGERQTFSGSIASEESGDELVAAAGSGPVEYQNVTGPTDADKQAYVDMRYGMMIHYGLNTFAGLDGHSLGGLANNTKPIYDAPFGGNGENPAPDNSVGSQQRTQLSSLFRAPYDNQAEFKRYVTDEWARVARDAGMTYMNLTTKHHWGWCLWPSAYTTYDIATSSTPNIDIWGAFMQSAKDYGMKVVIYYSFPDRVLYTGPGQNSNNNDAYLQYVNNQFDELLAYDTEKDTIVGAWIDYADHANSLSDARANQWIDHIRRWKSSMITMFNQRTSLADVENFEGGVNTISTTHHYGEKNLNFHRKWQRKYEIWYSYFEEDRLVNTAVDTLDKYVEDVMTSRSRNITYVTNHGAPPSGDVYDTYRSHMDQSAALFNGGGRIDDFDAGWDFSFRSRTFSGNTRNWKSWDHAYKTSESTGYWQNSLHSSNETGDWAEYKFFGKSLKLYVRGDANAGDMDIYIDGVFHKKFRSAVATGDALLEAYSTDSLSYREHTVRIVVGNEDEGSGKGFVNIDYMEVAPRVVEVLIVSRPDSGDTYAVGETVEFMVYFSGSVKVSGAPQLEIDVGGAARLANYVSEPGTRYLIQVPGAPPRTGDYISGSGTRRLMFSYVVQASDVDADGISVGANKLRLNGGSIMVDDGGSAVTTEADLNHVAAAADVFNKANGGGIGSTATAGDDLLVGQSGDSSYRLGLQTGFDQVYEGYVKDELSSNYMRASGDASDAIRLDSGIAVGDVRLARDSSSVWVQVLGAPDGEGNRDVVSSIKLVNYYENEQSKVERIVFADGTVWGRSHLEQIAISGGAGDDSLYGRNDMADIFDGSAGGNDRLVGLGGND